MTEQKQSIVAIVSEARYDAMFALRVYFGGSDDLSVLEGYQSVVSALQGLPPQAVKEVGIGIVARFFEDESLDPTSKSDRREAQPFAEVIAQGIAFAAQSIIQQMRAQQASGPASRLLVPR